MLDVERRLSERFADLRDSRDGPVFFIEHGLQVRELEQLRTAVRETARQHAPESRWWCACPLPLIVSAVEVGYRYRGTGTDFWPMLESELGIDISVDSRRNIRDLFETCSSKFRGTRPSATPWAAVFHLIAWPISHALVPREFHRQLATILSNIRADVSMLDDPSLHRAVRIAAGQLSARFATFLEDENLTVSVVRALLGDGNGEVSQDTICRIAVDLESDPDARRDITLAKRAQQRLHAHRSTPVETVALPALEGSLQLRRSDAGRLTIEVRFPTIEGPDAERLRRVLRRRRFAPRLWGVASPVPGERLFSGLPFVVELTSVPDASAHLFEELPRLGLDNELQRILESFKLDFHQSLLFVENTEGNVASRVQGKKISGHRHYWLLVSESVSGTVVGVPSIGEIGPFECFRLDPSKVLVRETLEHWGYSVRFGISVAFTGAPPLEDLSVVPRFLVGDERIIVPGRAHPAGSWVELDGERVPLGVGLVRTLVSEGKQFLEITSPGASQLHPFEGLAGVAANTTCVRACWIEMAAPEMTVQALLSGNIALRVEGLAPLEGLTLTVELEFSGHCVGITHMLGTLPQVLSGEHALWSTLLDEATREQVLRAPSLVLHARVGTLAAESWPLEQRLRPCWWVRRPLGFVLESELGPLEHGEVSVTAPTAPPATKSFEEAGDARLLSPLDLDEGAFGPVAHFTTLCLAPDTLTLSVPHVARPRLRRSRRTDENSLSAKQLVEAWLRWTLADSDSFSAEFRRRQVASMLEGWFTEVVCGETWSRCEAKVNTSFADPWMLLADACRESGRGLDPYVEVSTSNLEEIIQMAVAEIRHTLPELWLRIGLIVDDCDDRGESYLDTYHYDAFDAAFERAYQRLAENCRRAGNEQLADKVKEADPGSAPEQWDDVLEHVKMASEMRELGELLLPTDTAMQLLALDPSFMPMEEISEELRNWAVTSQTAFAGPVPGDATLEAILALWISPETAIVLDWRGALDTLLSERALARAARYLALRVRNVRHGAVA